MARKPNYQMERMDRDRAKAIKTAAKEAVKQAERAGSKADEPTQDKSSKE